MKVVYITDARLPTPRAHGAQIASSCDALARVGADVTLVYQQVPGHRRNTSIKDYYGIESKIKAVGIPGFDLPWLRSSPAGRPKRSLMGGYRVAWEFLASCRVSVMKADLFIMRNGTPYLSWFLAKTNRPTLIEFHSQPHGMSLKVHRSTASARGLRGIFGVTDGLGDTLARELEIERSKIRTLHDGVDTDRFASSNKSAEKDIDVLYAGSLLPNRGVSTLIRAAKSLPGKRITIVGGTEPELGRCQALAAELGLESICFTGHVHTSEIPGYLNRAKVAVLPMSGSETHTRYHASPLKLFEYMAAGNPIVASRLPSIQEVVEHGKHAHLVEPDDTEALASGIIEVLANDEYAESLGAAAKRKVSDYAWTNRAREMLAMGGLAAGAVDIGRAETED